MNWQRVKKDSRLRKEILIMLSEAQKGRFNSETHQAKLIILDNNPISIAKYMEEHPK